MALHRAQTKVEQDNRNVQIRYPKKWNAAEVPRSVFVKANARASILTKRMRETLSSTAVASHRPAKESDRRQVAFSRIPVLLHARSLACTACTQWRTEGEQRREDVLVFEGGINDASAWSLGKGISGDAIRPGDKR